MFHFSSLTLISQAVNNLLVLCRESETGAQMFWDQKLLPKLLNLIKTDLDKEVVVAAVRILDELAKSETRVSCCC